MRYIRTMNLCMYEGVEEEEEEEMSQDEEGQLSQDSQEPLEEVTLKDEVRSMIFG